MLEQEVVFPFHEPSERSPQGALKALLRAGMRVPKQAAVTGYNSSDYARLCEPVLTSVDNRPEQVVLLCVQLLEGRIKQSELFYSVTVQPELFQDRKVECESGPSWTALLCCAKRKRLQFYLCFHMSSVASNIVYIRKLIYKLEMGPSDPQI